MQIKHNQPVYLILGGNGLLGSAIYSKLCEKTSEYRIFSFNREMLDITDEVAIRSVFDFIMPTHVFNCAALSNIDLCEELKDVSFQLNSYCPEIIAKECNKIGAKLIHFSTGHLFNDKDGPHSENCIPNPINVYGKSKLLGEELINKQSNNNLIIRLGHPFHFNGNTFLSSSLLKAERYHNISIYEDFNICPTYVEDLMDLVISLINKEENGIYNICNGGHISEFEFIKTALELCQIEGHIIKVPNKSYINTKNNLSTNKIKNKLNIEIKDWKDSLKNCLFKMNKLVIEESNINI